MKTNAVKALACLFFFLLTRAGAQSVADLLQRGVSVQRAVVPLYPTNSFKLSAIVRVDRVFTDYQRRGFFRIGLLPVVVLDGVTFEAQDTSDPLGSLACVRRWLATKAGQRIEMRRVKFIFSRPTIWKQVWRGAWPRIIGNCLMASISFPARTIFRLRGPPCKWPDRAAAR